MLRKRLVSVLCVLTAMAGVLWAAGQPAKAAEPQRLKVITYNVQFLPGPAAAVNKRKNAPYRAERVGQLLSKFDIVGLNEIFDTKPRELLLSQFEQAWGDRYGAHLSPKPSNKQLMGGCAIVSHLPILETNSVLYSKASTIKQYGFGADEFAAKGAIHVRLKRNAEAADSDAIDVFATHLESKDDEARSVQYQELGEFIGKHSDPKRPLLIMGDMNTHGDDDERPDPKAPYHEMMAAYQKGRGEAKVLDLWLVKGKDNGQTTEQEPTDKGNRIDYILYSNPVGFEALVPRMVEVNHYQDERVTALSDHSAVEAEFDWMPKP
jgi:endonuclease/exonuclease/phosphatase family metal-dependent hydrolase